jgi:NmrA-like family
VRAVTRDPSKPAAKALEALGASIVPGDFNDALSIRRAVSGAQIIFHNTDFWGVLSVDKEVAHGLTIAEAAADVNTLEHFVFSGLSDPEKLFNGKYKNNLPYNSKSKIEKGIRDKFPALWSKTTTLYLGLYHSNWLLPVFSPMKVSRYSAYRCLTDAKY